MEPRNFCFSEALSYLKQGRKLARAGWNGKGIFVFLVIQAQGFKPRGEGDVVTRVNLDPFVAIDSMGIVSDNPDAVRTVRPWLASQTDLLAEDWQLVD